MTKAKNFFSSCIDRDEPFTVHLVFSGSPSNYKRAIQLLKYGLKVNFPKESQVIEKVKEEIAV